MYKEKSLVNCTTDSARWVPKQLTDEHKAQRVDVSQALLKRCHRHVGGRMTAACDFGGYDEASLENFITGDETWKHKPSPETKSGWKAVHQRRQPCGSCEGVVEIS